MPGDLIYLTAFGASTPLGQCAWSSAAAVRAGISGFSQHPYMMDCMGEPLRIARAPWLDIELADIERYAALLFPAIDQVLEHVPTSALGELRVGLYLGLPAQRPGLPGAIEQRLIAASERRYGAAFCHFVPIASGHSAGMSVLEAATRDMWERRIDVCVIGCVDSYLTAETLEWLEQNEQLHGAGPLNNAWGFVPGEAAGALLLMPGAVADFFAIAPVARLLGVGTAQEQNCIKTETICVGVGLTRAFQRAFETIPSGGRVTDVYCDMNGEPYRADEYGFACLRTAESFVSASDFVAPADCWGDVGAASGALSIALAAIAGFKRYANGLTALIWASSENGNRGAALLAAGGNQ